MKKSLVLVAVIGLGVAAGLQADYRNHRPSGRNCTFTLVNDSGADIMVKDVHNNEVFNIPVGGKAELNPSRRHNTTANWSHHRVVNIYVKRQDGSAPLTYKLFERRCDLNEEPTQLTMTKVKEYINYYNPRFRTYEVGHKCTSGCRHHYHSHYHTRNRSNAVSENNMNDNMDLEDADNA